MIIIKNFKFLKKYIKLNKIYKTYFNLNNLKNEKIIYSTFQYYNEYF